MFKLDKYNNKIFERMNVNIITTISVLLSVVHFFAQGKGIINLSLKECVRIATEKDIKVSLVIQEKEKVVRK